ncbi:MAG: NAD(P)-dependent oxidoreductase [Chloroflexi bacterium]|nr:NAD(P)-dependent oxidoreductase [Chloroflexota bacterium]
MSAPEAGPPPTTSNQPLRVGVLGLGIMGAAMARNIVGAGFPLVISDRSRGPVSELVGDGATLVSTPAEVAATSDVLVVNVPDTADLQALVDDPEGIVVGAHPALVVVAMGTHDPGAMPPIARQLADRGAAFLDAPVSGGDIGARDGTLSIMVGGDASALERARPVLESLGRTITHIGPSGAGQVAKACNQLVVGSTIQAVAEAYILALVSGVDPARVLDALKGGLAGSVILDRYSRRMLAGDFAPGGRARLHAKDARIVMAAAAAAGVTLPGFEPIAAAFETLVANGAGDLDHSALVTLLDGWQGPAE